MSHSDVKMRNLSCVRTHSHLRLFRCAVLCEHFDAIQRSAFLILAKASLGSIGGSKRALGTPPPIQFLSFPCSFWRKPCEIIDFLPKLRSWRPPPGIPLVISIQPSREPRMFHRNVFTFGKRGRDGGSRVGKEGQPCILHIFPKFP